MTVVRLSVHKNTREQRAQRAFRKRLVQVAKETASAMPAHGFLVMTWDREFQTSTYWETGRVMSADLLPEFIAHRLRREMTKQAMAQDDLSPPEDSA